MNPIATAPTRSAAQPLADRAHRGHVEIAQDAPAAVEPPGHGEAQRPGDERQRALHVHVVLLEPLLIAHLEDVAHPLGGDERSSGALPLDQRVRGQGRAVDEDRDLRRRQPHRGEHAPDPVEDADFGRRRGQHLGAVAPGGALEDHVGERAADVG
jgi:hypothetical protein